MKTLQEMRDAAEAARQAAGKILDKAKAEDRDLTKEEDTAFENAMADCERIKKMIALEERVGNAEWTGAKPGDRKTGHDRIDAKPGNGSQAIEARAWDFETHKIETRTIEPDEVEYARATREYRDAWRKSLVNPEDRTLNISVGEKGHAIAPLQVASRFFMKVDDQNFMRRLCPNIPVIGSGGLGIFGVEANPSDAAWTSEVTTTDATADTAMKFGRRELHPHLLIKALNASRTMLNRLPSVEGYITDRLAYVTAAAEEKAFLTGSGANQPLGIFTASDAGVSTARDINSGSTTNWTADGVLSVYYALKEPYRRNAVWLMHRDGIMRVRKLKHTSGDNYLWVQGFGGEPSTLMGRPVYESEYAPSTWTENNYVAMFFDPNQYQIATAVNLEMFRDPYTGAGTNKVRFLVYHESDGMPILDEAFARVKLAS